MRGRVLAVTAIVFAAQKPAQKTAAPLSFNGVWEAVKVNAQALPMTDRVVGDDRLTHVIRLHEMTIRLRPNGKFQASLRYRQAILSKGEKIETAPLQNDVWTGDYTVKGPHMKFVPERQGKRQVQPFEGDAAGRMITVGFDYEIVTRRHYVLQLNKNDSIY